MSGCRLEDDLVSGTPYSTGVETFYIEDDEGVWMSSGGRFSGFGLGGCFNGALTLSVYDDEGNGLANMRFDLI